MPLRRAGRLKYIGLLLMTHSIHWVSSLWRPQIKAGPFRILSSQFWTEISTKYPRQHWPLTTLVPSWLQEDLSCPGLVYISLVVGGLILMYGLGPHWFSLQYSSVAQSCPTPCDPMKCRTPGFPVHHQLPEPTQTPVHHIGDAIQPSHPLSSPSSPTVNLSQHQGLFQWVSSSHQVAKVLEFQLQHQPFQWIFRTDFL